MSASPPLPPPLATIVLVLAFHVGGCQRADPCAHTGACPPPAVCQPDGTCRPLGKSPAMRTAHRVAALDWATEHGDGSPAEATDLDVLCLGGAHDAIAHVAFGPLPHGKVARATATLFPHPSWSGSDHPWRVAAIAGKRPDQVRARNRPALDWRPERTVVRMRTGVGRPLRIDVTALARAATEEGVDRVQVGLRLLDRRVPALRFASPRVHDASLRPRLDVGIR
jgi:hypothetical protein